MKGFLFLFFGWGQAEPLLKTPSGESSLTDILLQRNLPQSQSVDYGLLPVQHEHACPHCLSYYSIYTML